MLLTLLQNKDGGGGGAGGGSGGSSSSAGSSSGGRAPIRQVSMQPVLQRAMALKAPKVKPAKERQAKRAKAIEQRAAEVLVSGAGEGEMARMLADWQAQRPVIPAAAAEYAPMDLFLAQVAFRIQQMDLLRNQDDEEALIALLLA